MAACACGDGCVGVCCCDQAPVLSLEKRLVGGKAPGGGPALLAVGALAMPGLAGVGDWPGLQLHHDMYAACGRAVLTTCS